MLCEIVDYPSTIEKHFINQPYQPVVYYMKNQAGRRYPPHASLTDKTKSLGPTDYKHYNIFSKTGHYKKTKGQQTGTYANKTTKTTSEPPPFIFFRIFTTF